MISGFAHKADGDKIQCTLCPRNCRLLSGETGFCHIRRNQDERIINEAYRLYSGISFDPIEKKPLYHFYPGSTILSAGTVGCNMHCQWCQNCEISQTGVKHSRSLTYLEPADLLNMAAKDAKNIGIAYTYNEPTINFESIIETGPLFRNAGYKNVFVTNGYISQEALKEYLQFADAFNVDIKSFNQKIHVKFTGAALKPVLDTCISIRKADCHLELTYLIIPGVNDGIADFSLFLKWVSSELGTSTILHLSRYFPRYKFTSPTTSVQLMQEFYSHAREQFFFTYPGNLIIPGTEDTFCPSCGELLIKRSGYSAVTADGVKDGKCRKCSLKVFTGA
jgi:pyruvate formate lyase activating enzyme